LKDQGSCTLVWLPSRTIPYEKHSFFE